MKPSKQDKRSDNAAERDAERLADEFVTTVAQDGVAFTFLAGDDYPIFTMHEAEVMPFWSSRKLAEQVQRDHPESRNFKIARIEFDQFHQAILPEMAEQGVLVGVNWSGRVLMGFDQPAEELLDALDEAMR